jgi:multiple sugar transport system substrate-binding protein
MKRLPSLVATLAAVIAVGVTPANAEPRPAGTITLAGWASSPVESALLENTIAAFEASHPDIHVDYRPDYGDYTGDMEAAFAAGNPPDVFYVDAAKAPKWIANGWLKPLNNYIRESDFSTTPFFKPLLAAFTGPGDRIYGLPKDWSPLAVYSNDALLQTAGVAPPSTWAELRAAAERIVVPGSAPVCLTPSWTRALALVYQNGGALLSPDSRLVTIDSPAAYGAIDFLLGLVRDGLAATSDRLGESWCGQAFADGRAAIVLEGNWLAPFLDDLSPWIDYTISPMLHNVQRGNIAFTVSYSIGTASPNKRAAWEFIRYATGPDGMAVWTSGGLALPSRSDVAPAPGREAFIADADVARVWQFPLRLDPVLPYADDELAAAFAGDRSPGDVGEHPSRGRRRARGRRRRRRLGESEPVATKPSARRRAA